MDRRAERNGTISGSLTTAGWGSAARTASAGDASFRRYSRQSHLFTPLRQSRKAVGPVLSR